MLRLTLKLRGTVLVSCVLLTLACGSSADEGEGPTLARSLSTTAPGAGTTIVVTLQPAGFTGFFAVQESLGDLELVSHTADSFSNGVFVQLVAEDFEYVVKVPASSPPGRDLEISGEFWTDPEARLPVEPRESIATIR